MNRKSISTRPIIAGRLRAAAQWWPLALILAGAGAVSYLAASHAVSVETFRDWQSQLTLMTAEKPVLAAAALVAATAVYLILSLPAEGVLTALGGMLFGTVLGTALSVAGTVLAATLLFFGLRFALRYQLTAPHGPKVEAMLRRLEQDGVNYLLMLRLLPVLPFALVSLLAVLVRMRAWPYTAATVIGVIPPTVVFTSAGSGLGTLSARPGPLDFGSLLSGRVLLPLAGIAALAVLPVGLRYWRAYAARGSHDPAD